MKEQIKQCPFCGYEDQNVSETEGCDYVIMCNLCGASMMDDMTWEDDYDGRKNVIKKWNLRSIPIESIKIARGALDTVIEARYSVPDSKVFMKAAAEKSHLDSIDKWLDQCG